MQGERETAAALLELARDVAGLGEPTHIAQRLAAAVPKVIDADASAVVMFDWDRRLLHVEGLWGWSPELAEAVAGFELPLDASPLISALVAKPEPVYVTPDIVDPVISAVLAEFETDAVLVVPITRRGEAIGLVAAVKRGRAPKEVTPELTERLQALADTAGTAIDNALLYVALQEQLVNVAALEGRYRSISELTSDVAYAYVVGADGSTAVEWSTDGIERLSGYTAAEAVALGGWPGLVVPEDAALLQAHSERLRQGEESSEEFRIRTKDDEIRWIEITDRPSPQEGGPGFRIYGAVRDVTERRTAQERLAEREAQLLDAQRMAQIGSWRVQADMKILSWSEEMGRIFGWTEEDPPSIDWVMEHIHPADVQGLGAAVERLTTTAGITEHEYRIVRADGSVRWMHMRADADYDEAGAVVAYNGTTQDVTARHEAEEYRRVIADAVSDAVFSYRVVDGDLILEWVSDAWTRLSGYPTDPTPTQLFVPIAYPDDFDVMGAAEVRVLAGERTVDEFRVRVADGSTRWLRIYAIPVFDSRGAVQRVYGAAQDVTERRVAEEALAASEAYLRQLIDASPLSVMVFDGRGRVSLMNPAAEDLFGFSLEDAQASRRRPPWVDPEHEEEYDALGARLADGERVTGLETKRVRKDGTMVDVAVSLAPLIAKTGEMAGGISVMADISERVQLEEELRQAQKMNAIGRLAGGVAHDFNNILTAILGHAEFLLEEAADPLVVKSHAESIRLAAERASAVTEQMLMMSRHRAPVAEILDLSVEVTAMRDMLARLIGEQITFEMRLAPDPCWVRVAKTHVHQVLLNLIVNAREAMPAGGTVTIETSVERAGLNGAGASVLRVIDTGEGMDGLTRERVFEPFFTTKETGVGLGLSVVYGIVQSNRGEISVETRPGAGSTFEVRLPLATGLVYTQNRQPSAPVPRQRGLVMLVEDEEDVRSVAAAALTRRGYQVLAAGDALEALTMAEGMAGGVDVLVTDLIMPNMGGQELAAVLRQRWPGVRVLYMSGYSEALPGSDDTPFLQKPFTPDALLEAVGGLLIG